MTEHLDPFAALPLPEGPLNIAQLLPRAAAERPEQPAVIVARTGEQISYAALEERSNRIASGLADAGLGPRDRVCLFVRPGVELIALTYALFKLGAVPVLADAGMGRKRLMAVVKLMAPRGFIGIPKAHVGRRLFPDAFRSIEVAVTVGRRLFWGGPTLAGLERGGDPNFATAETSADDEAAILFTSGSTGPPKGVSYTHGMFHAQVEVLDRLYRFAPGEVDLCCFPLFALFDVAYGMTSVFPDMDPSQPATCDPARIFAAAQEYGATTTFGSPAIWSRVAPWCTDNGYKLERLRRVLVAGAPVSPDLIHELHRVLPMDGDVFTPYGATEGLPVTSIAGRDVVPELVGPIRSGAGTCVGEVAPGIDLRLIGITDDVIETWSDALEVSLGLPGEVCVRGPVVSSAYVEADDHTRRAKIHHGDGSVWHRMGDIARFDGEGRLWFLGRKSHRLHTRNGLRMPVPVENVFNIHERVRRTALIGVGAPGSEVPLLVVEPLPGEFPRTEVMTEGFILQLRSIGRKHHATRDIDNFMFHEGFPVDVRHNAKIDREELKAWAEAQLA
ncbi:MAG: fatty acid CoA ligase family protein [Planctomycetota bacterium]|nr:fatty acid CoA ligase family protein [Planctomycetota bacterium]